MRLLRNRGALAAMPSANKTELALKLLNCSHGPLASNTHHLGRADMNKLAKEAFVCLAESCSQAELAKVRGSEPRAPLNQSHTLFLQMSVIEPLGLSPHLIPP